MKKITVTVIILLALLTSCDFFASLIQPLIGTWSNEYETITFNYIGFELENTQDGYSFISGDYTVSGDKLTLSFTTTYGYDAETVFTYEINGDELTLVLEGSGTIFTFIRE